MLRSFLLFGALVLLGIFTAAQGLENIAPEVPGRILELTREGNLWSGSVFGKSFMVDTGTAVETAARLGEEIEPVLEQVRNYRFEEIIFDFMNRFAQ